MSVPPAPPRFTTLSDILRYRTRGLTSQLGEMGIRYHISPDAVTIAGLVLVLIAAWLAAQGDFLIAGIVLILWAWRRPPIASAASR